MGIFSSAKRMMVSGSTVLGPEKVAAPRKTFFSLEPRILFDGAGLASVEHQLDEGSKGGAIRVENKATVAADNPLERFDGRTLDIAKDALLPGAPGKIVMVIDSRVVNYQALLQGIDPQAIVRIIGAEENGLNVIGQVLGSTGEVSNLQIVSHGESGALVLGNTRIDNNALSRAEVAGELRAWQYSMTAQADILLLGCDVAQGTKGQDFVQKLADLTQADISASDDLTGSGALGGNWTLEFVVGDVTSRIAFKEASLTSYESILPAGPTTTLTVDPKPLIGSTNNNGSVTFVNTGTVGYSPYVTLAFDQTGKDPSNTTPTPSEGVAYVAGSARYLGSALPAEFILTFAGGQASSGAITNAAGTPIVFNLSDYAGMQDGDQLVVFKLPFGSFVGGQPDATIDFKYNVGANADSANTVAEGGGSASKALNIVSRGLFTLGDTPTGFGGAILQGAGTVASAAPSWFTTSYTNTSRENEQVPGANDRQLFQSLLDIAPGQTVLSDATERFVSRLSIPNNIAFDPGDLALRNNAGTSGGDIAGTTYLIVDKVTGVAATQNADKTWSSPNGVEVRAIAPIGTYTGNLTLNVSYFIPRSIISETTGTDIPQTFDAKQTGQVRFSDTDDAQAQSFQADPNPVLVNYQTIQIQKAVTGASGDVLDAANPAGVRSGDVLSYSLNVQVGDFYGLRDVLVTDVLPDGIDYNGNATISISSNGVTRTGSLSSFTPVSNNASAVTIDVQTAGGNATQSVGGAGKWVLQFDVSGFAAANGLNGSLPAGGAAGDLYGDVFKDATSTSLTVVTITYTGTVRDQYRVAANGNPATGTKVNENDVLTNNVWISGTLIQNTGTLAAPTLVDTTEVNSDTSSATTSIKDGNLLLEIYAINGVRVDDPNLLKNALGEPLISPGDNVTYRLRYDLTQGDYTNLSLTAYLPDPVFSATDADDSGSADAAGSAPGSSGFSKATDTVATTGPSANWAQAGRYTILGTGTNVPPLSGAGGVPGVPNTAVDAAYAANTISITTTTLESGNNITFTLPNNNDVANPGGTANNQVRTAATKVDLLFTVAARNQLFADGMLLTAQGREVSERSVNGGVTVATPLPDNRIIPVVIGTPQMTVRMGAIATGASNQDGTVPTAGSVTAGSNSGLGTVARAGTSVATAPFTGTIARAGQIDGNMVNVDANDMVRFGFAIENFGQTPAYNVRTQAITPPAGFRFVNGTDITDAANNMQVRRGDGTLLVAGVDYTVAGNVISFIDRDLSAVPDGIVDSVFGAGKLAGVVRTDGKNVVVITFDTVADNGVPATQAYAGATATAVAGVDRATSSVDVTGANFVVSPISDNATVQMAKPTADLRWQGDSTDADVTATSDDSDRLGNGATNSQLVIGESGWLDMKVTIPEGETKALFANVNLPAGLKLDTSYNGGAGYEIITTVAGTGSNGVGLNGELGSSFGGTIANPTASAALIAGISGTLGQSGVGARIDLGTVTNPSTTATNDTGNNSFIIRVRVIADNQLTNQQSTTLSPTSSTLYTQGVDVTSGAGGTATSVAEVTTTNNPVITIVDPTVTTIVSVAVIDVDPLTAGLQAGTEADEGDIVEYTITLNNPGTINAYDLALNDVFPTYLLNDGTLSISSVSSSGALVNGVATSLTASDLSLNTAARTLNFNAASNVDLNAGGTITIKIRATVNNSAASVSSFSDIAETTWTSIDDTGAASATGERTGAFGGPLLANGTTTVDAGAGASSGVGANQTLTTAGLNNYRTASSAVVPVASLQPSLSRIGGLSDSSPAANNNPSGDTKDGSPTLGTAQDMLVGEVTRFRMVVRIPEGSLTDVALQPTLPAGYTFLNDGTARVAFVADTGIASSGAAPLSGAGLVKGDGSAGTGPVVGGSAAIFGSIQNSLSTSNFTGTDPRASNTAPTFSLPGSNILTSGNGSAASPLFLLGTLQNSDSDSDSEYVVIEFNAVVANASANQQGTNLDTSFVIRQNASTTNVQLGITSNITRDRVIEPYVASISRSLADVTPGAVGATNRVTFADSFTNSGSAAAYDVVLTDAGNPTPGTVNAAFTSLTVGATTYNSITAASLAGINVTANANGFNVSIPKLAAGESVTLRYAEDVPTNIAQAADATTEAVVTYSSMPGGLAQQFAASTAGAAGSATGERNGTGSGLPNTPVAVTATTGPVDNYLARDGAGFGTISGALWNDTGVTGNMAATAGNGVIDASEQLLAGVSVSLQWAGADGVFGNADDRTLTTTTNASGQYSFGALPAGQYRVTAPGSLPGVTPTDAAASGDTDTLAIRFDRDGGALGSIAVTLGDGVAQTTRDFAYVEQNDAPTLTAPATYPDVNDSASRTVNGLVFADIDGGSTSLETVTLQAVNGLGTFSATSAGGVVVAGAGAATMTLRGTLANINSFIAANSVSFVPATTPVTTAEVIRVTINDEGNRGDFNGNGLPSQAGGTASPDARTATADVTLNIVTANIAPVVRLGTLVPGAVTSASQVSAVEDTALSFTGTNRLTIADPNDAGLPLTVTLSVPAGDGVLGLPAATGVTVTAGASGTSTLTITGNLTNVNAALAGLSFTPRADRNLSGSGSSLTVQVADGGNGGYGGSLVNVVSNQVIKLPITPVNDAPAFVSTAPTMLPAVFEDTVSGVTTVSAAFPGFSDAKDASESNGADQRVGVVLINNASVASQGNWQYFDGTAWQDVPRNLSAANALYLPDGTQLRFNPQPNFNGTPGMLTARLVENDQSAAGAIVPDLPAGASSAGFGATGAIRTGVDLTAGVGGTTRISGNTRDLGIVIDPVNDLPTVLTPAPTAAQALPIGDVPITFTGANSIRLGDPLDFPANDGPVVRVTITPTSNGRPFMSTLTPGVAQISGPAVGQVPGTPGTPIVLEGTLADINAALQNLQYRSAAFYNGIDSFTVSIDDRANGGPGPLNAASTVFMNNLPLNDRPVVNGPVAPDYAAMDPGATSAARSIQELFGARYTDPRDAPSSNGGDAFAGVAVISTPTAAQGRYQYSADGGTTWVDIAPGLTPATALVLAPATQLRFIANPAFVGEVSKLQAVLIETDQKPPLEGDLMGRAGIPFDGPTSAAPVNGTVIDLSKLEATEASTTTNGIGRSRFSSLAAPMEVGVRINPPFIETPLLPAPIVAGPTPLPTVLSVAQAAASAQFVESAVVQAQAQAVAQDLIARARFNGYLGNSGLQPNWLAPEGVPGIDPFRTAALPEVQRVPDPMPAPAKPQNVKGDRAQTDDDCAKPRVVAKPRVAGKAPAPRLAPGSEAAKRFSEQIKRARLKSRC